MPGRIIGVSEDAHGHVALPHGAADARAAHPPREGDEQHLHRAGAARGDRRHVRRLPRARRGCARSPSACTRWPRMLARGPREAGRQASTHAPLLRHAARRRQRGDVARSARSAARARGSTCAGYRRRRSAISLDETTDAPPTWSDLARRSSPARQARALERRGQLGRRRRRSRWPARCARTSAYLTHPVFNTHHSETRDAALHAPAGGEGPVAHALDDPARLVHDEAQRDRRDDAGDLARVRASCTRSRPPRRPRATATIFDQLEQMLVEITGFAAVSLQPNAGSQGEYAGLLVIRAYHESRGAGAPRRLPDPVVRARHQPGVGGDGRLPRRGRRLRRRRQRRPRRPRARRRRSTRTRSRR